jgi:hypothetical protein
MQCTGFLHYLPTQERLRSECYETEPRVRLSLQIAQGTDLRTSIIRNNYTIGFSGSFRRLTASLQCQICPLAMRLSLAAGSSKHTAHGGGSFSILSESWCCQPHKWSKSAKSDRTWCVWTVVERPNSADITARRSLTSWSMASAAVPVSSLLNASY